jgi:hypothetical protein
LAIEGKLDQKLISLAKNIGYNNKREDYMALIFYPHQEDINHNISISEKLDILLDSAQRYKSIMMDSSTKTTEASLGEIKNCPTPREMEHVFNWDEIAKILNELRNLPENTPTAKIKKGDYLAKLAEVYEVLRGAKMPKLKAVCLALMSEASQLKGGNAA